MVVAVILQLIKQTLQKSDIFHLVEGAFGPHYILHSKLAMGNNKAHLKIGGLYEQSSWSPLSGPAICICCVSIYQELVHIKKIGFCCVNKPKITLSHITKLDLLSLPAFLELIIPSFLKHSLRLE